MLKVVVCWVSGVWVKSVIVGNISRMFSARGLLGKGDKQVGDEIVK